MGLFMSLNYRIEVKDGWEVVHLTGRINEDAEVSLAELKAKLAKQCIINLKEIEAINSLGVRAWINFMRDLEKGREIVFEECTPEVVSQINMIPNFKGKSHIRSVYASYLCENCGEQKLELLTEGKNLPKVADEGLPPVNCPKCKEVMEMEELEDEFFAWLETN